MVAPKDQIVNVVTYSPQLDFQLPLSFASGETHQFLATAEKVLDASANPPKAIKVRIDLWADAPIAVFGADQSLAYVSSSGAVIANQASVKAQGAKGVYSSPDTNYLYIATESALTAFDTKTGKEVRKLIANNPKNVAVVNGGQDVLFAHETNKLSLYDRYLSSSKFELKFNEDQSIWSLDLHDDRLAVVTWEGKVLSAKWVARLYDLKSKKELKNLEFNHAVVCFVLRGNDIAIVSDDQIRWEHW